MKKEELINLVKKYSNEMLFEVNEAELDFFVKSVDAYLSNCDVDIKNFDISKWSKYDFIPEQIYSGHVREDVVCEETSDNLLSNSINIAEGYVVIKNEK